MNWLTHDVGDPLIGTPEYKISAVRVEAPPRLMADSLAPSSSRAPEGPLRPAVHYDPECESTQLLLLADARRRGGRDRQSDRRPGRYGRVWEAPPGRRCSARSFSIPRPSATPELTLVGAIAAAEAVEGATGLTAQIKWPNDVMLNRRKVGGVLGELPDGVVTLGIGVNVNQTREQLPWTRARRRRRCA